MPINDYTDVPNCALLLHRRSLSALAHDAAIAQWNDESGNARHATQGTAAARPKYKKNSLDSFGAGVFFDGTDDFLNLPNFLTGFTAGEVFIVMRTEGDPAAAQTKSGIWVFGTSADTSSWGDHHPWTDSIIYNAFGSSARKTVGNPGPDLRDMHFMNIHSAASDWAARLNEIALFSTATNTVAWHTSPRIGRSLADPGEHYTHGHIFAVILYSRKLTTTERADVIAKLQSDFEFLASSTDWAGYTLDAHPVGWLELQGTGGDYQIKSDAAFKSGRGLKLLSATAGWNLLHWARAAAHADQKVLAKVRVTGGSSSQFNLLLRHNRASSPDYVECALVSGTTARIGTVVGATFTERASAAFAYSLNEWLWVRAETIGSAARIKVWRVGDAEPAGWTVEFTTLSGASLNAGGVGVGVFGSSGLFDVDQFGFGLNGREAPLSPAVKPDTPTCSVGSITRTSCTLSGSVFNDPDGGTHAASQWQVDEQGGDWSTPVHDSGETTTDKTSHAVSGLLAGTAYQARLRYKDSEGLWSDWSAAALFTTIANDPPSTPAAPTITRYGGNFVEATSSAYSDPEGDAHTASQWQVDEQGGDWTTPLIDSGETAAFLTQWRATGAPVATDLQIRVRYKDSLGGWSDWSPAAFWRSHSEVIPAPVIAAKELRDNTALLRTRHRPDPNPSWADHASLEWQVWLAAQSAPIGENQGARSSDYQLHDGAGGAAWGNRNEYHLWTRALTAGTAYKARCRRRQGSLVAGDWSAELSFTTAATFGSAYRQRIVGLAPLWFARFAHPRYGNPATDDGQRTGGPVDEMAKLSLSPVSAGGFEFEETGAPKLDGRVNVGFAIPSTLLTADPGDPAYDGGGVRVGSQHWTGPGFACEFLVKAPGLSSQSILAWSAWIEDPNGAKTVRWRWRLLQTATKNLRLELYDTDGSTILASATTSTAYNAGTRLHIVARYSGSVLSIVVDGVERVNATLAGWTKAPAQTVDATGLGSWPDYFDDGAGATLFDEWAFYSSLTNQQALDNYNAGVAAAAAQKPVRPYLALERAWEEELEAEIIASVHKESGTPPPFVDPDGGAHQATRWQLDTGAGDFSAPLVDETVTSVAELLGKLFAALTKATEYRLRVQYQDSTGTWSDWSDHLLAATFEVFVAVPAANPSTVRAPSVALPGTPRWDWDAEGSSATRWEETVADQDALFIDSTHGPMEFFPSPGAYYKRTGLSGSAFSRNSDRFEPPDGLATATNQYWYFGVLRYVWGTTSGAPNQGSMYLFEGRDSSPFERLLIFRGEYTTVGHANEGKTLFNIDLPDNTGSFQTFSWVLHDNLAATGVPEDEWFSFVLQVNKADGWVELWVNGTSLGRKTGVENANPLNALDARMLWGTSTGQDATVISLSASRFVIGDGLLSDEDAAAASTAVNDVATPASGPCAVPGAPIYLPC